MVLAPHISRRTVVLLSFAAFFIAVALFAGSVILDARMHKDILPSEICHLDWVKRIPVSGNPSLKVNSILLCHTLGDMGGWERIIDSTPSLEALRGMVVLEKSVAATVTPARMDHTDQIVSSERYREIEGSIGKDLAAGVAAVQIKSPIRLGKYWVVCFTIIQRGLVHEELIAYEWSWEFMGWYRSRSGGLQVYPENDGAYEY